LRIRANLWLNLLEINVEIWYNVHQTMGGSSTADIRQQTADIRGFPMASETQILAKPGTITPRSIDFLLFYFLKQHYFPRVS